MSKWYEVVVETVKVYAVEVEDSETAGDAQGYVMDNTRFDGDPSVRDCDLISKDAIDVARRCADEVLPI